LPIIRNCDARCTLCHSAPESLELPSERYLHYRNLLVTGSAFRRDYIGPAFFLMPRDLFIAVGGFSEVRLEAAEDFEFCHRLRRRGVSIVFEPSVSVPHLFSADWAGVERRVRATAIDGARAYRMLGILGLVDAHPSGGIVGRVLDYGLVFTKTGVHSVPRGVVIYPPKDISFTIPGLTQLITAPGAALILTVLVVAGVLLALDMSLPAVVAPLGHLGSRALAKLFRPAPEVQAAGSPAATSTVSAPTRAERGRKTPLEPAGLDFGRGSDDRVLAYSALIRDEGEKVRLEQRLSDVENTAALTRLLPPMFNELAGRLNPLLLQRDMLMNEVVDPALANRIAKVFAGEGEATNFEFAGIANDHGMSIDEDRDLTDQLFDRGIIKPGHSIIPSIRGVKQVVDEGDEHE